MNYKRITVATFAVIAAVLCAILAISVFGATIKLDPYAESRILGERLEELKAELATSEENIVNIEASIAEENEKLPALKKDLDNAQKALKKAKDNLSAVCTRNYYSSYFCDEAANCEELHDKVASESTKYSKAENKVLNCENAIRDAQEKLQYAKDRVNELKNSISNVSSDKSKATARGFFFFLAMIISVAGFVVLAKFILSTERKKFGYIACALMAASSFIYILLPTKTSGFVYVLSIVLSLIFYALISETTESRIALRVIAIIISIIVLLSTIFFAPFVGPLYVLTMILITMVLVPCVFTEYIDIAKYIFFTIITFGIWHLIWVYNVTENLNKVESAEKRPPVRELLLYIFLPLYNIYWTYKTAEATELYGAEKGKLFKINILCLAFSFVNPLIPSILIQDKTNIIVGKPEAEVPANDEMMV